MSDMLKYYEAYYKDTPADQMYTMEAKGHPSRMLTFKDWLQASVNPGGRILDIGCGDMHFSTLMPQYEWVGIDFNIDRAKGKAIKHDIMQTPYPGFEPASFDAIVCSEVLEHVWDLRVIHREARRLLKKTGIYIISTPNFQWLDHYLMGFAQLITDPRMTWTMEHIRQYTSVTHTRFLNETGFEVTKVAGADPQYSGHMAHAVKVLHQNVEALSPGLLSEDRAAQLVGYMFPHINHTVILEARKV